VAGTGLSSLAQLLSFALSIPACDAYIEQVFSLTKCCGKREGNNSREN
jgi:hypothetical protein